MVRFLRMALPRLSVVIVAATVLAAPGGAAVAQPPPTWAPPVVVDVTPVSAVLTWTSPTTDPEVTYYRVYRVTTRDGAPYDQFYNASYTTSLLLALLTPDTEYTFFVETGDQTSNGLRSQPVTFRTLPAPDDTEPPSPPGQPEASAVTPHSLTLSWAPATDNVGVVGYDVYQVRSDGTPNLTARVVAIGTDQPAWQLTRLLPDFDYEFHVVAFDASGNRSAPSEPVQLRTPAVSGSSCEVTFAAQSAGAGLVEGMIALQYVGSFAEVWTLRFSLPGGQEIVFGPLPGWAQTGAEVVAWYEGWAGGLAPGQELLWFVATGAVSDPPPTGYSVNGQPCTVLP